MAIPSLSPSRLPEALPSPRDTLGTFAQALKATGAASAHARRLLCAAFCAAETALKSGDGRLAQAVWSLARLSEGGYYHNVPLSGAYSAYSIGGRRQNRPLSRDDSSEVLWGLIRAELDVPLSGLSVSDIGSAEGFFAIRMAQAGAKVTAIESQPHYRRRLRVLAHYHRVADRIRIISGWYPEEGQEWVKASALVLCLGLIYHLDNLEKELAPLVEGEATLVIESTFYRPDVPRTFEGYAEGFNPSTHANNEPVCHRWLEVYLARAGYDVTWVDAWRAFVEQPGNIRYRRTLAGAQAAWGECVTRGLLVARRRQ